MWNLIAILILLFAIYNGVKSLYDYGIVKRILNRRDSVVHIRQIMQAYPDENQAVERIQKEFSIRLYPATKIWRQVHKMH
jgi:hypothetical protein